MKTRRLLVAVATVAVGATIVAPPATAGSAPFDDPSATGYIGFCDRSGHQVRSGQVGAAPFAYRAVASQAAPAGYSKAVLYLFQPRREVDPGEWSGKQMTAATDFSNPAHPMAAGTGYDPAFIDFAGGYPLKWDGYAQVRMFFTSPGRLMQNRRYPAAVVRMSGDTWTQVGGGDVPCTAGSATSVELRALPSSILARPTARSTPGASAPAPAHGSASGSAAASGTAPAAATASPSATAPAAADGSPVARATSSGGAGDAGWIVASVLAAGAAAGSAVAVARRRRAG